MIQVQVQRIPRLNSTANMDLKLAEGASISELLKQLQIPSQGILTMVDGKFVDESYTLQKSCTIQLIAAVSGGTASG